MHTNISVADIWRWPSSSFDLRTAFFIAKLIVTVPDTEVKDCNLCHCSFLDVMMHSSCECSHTADQRNIFFDLIIENFPLDLYVELSYYNPGVLYCVMLGKQPSTELVKSELNDFRTLCFTHVVRSAADYNRMLNSILSRS